MKLVAAGVQALYTNSSWTAWGPERERLSENFCAQRHCREIPSIFQQLTNLSCSVSCQITVILKQTFSCTVYCNELHSRMLGQSHRGGHQHLSCACGVLTGWHTHGSGGCRERSWRITPLPLTAKCVCAVVCAVQSDQRHLHGPIRDRRHPTHFPIRHVWPSFTW